MRLRADEIGCLGVLAAATWLWATFSWMLCFWALRHGGSVFELVAYFVLAVFPGAVLAGIVASSARRRAFVSGGTVFAAVEGLAAIVAQAIVLMLMAGEFGR